MYVKATSLKIVKAIGTSAKRTFWDCPSRLISRLEGNTETVNFKNTMADFVSCWIWTTVLGCVVVSLAPALSMFYTLTAVGLAAEIISFGIVSRNVAA